MERKLFDPRILAVTAVMTAITFALTRVVQVPTPVVGYIHLGDVGVFFSAFAFGPWVGAVVGGLGTALADLTSPYAQWAIFSLLIHGAQGWAAGWISARWQNVRGPLAVELRFDRDVGLDVRVQNVGGVLLATVVGGAIVVVGYLFAGTILIGFGAALTEVPLNIVQVAAGAIVSVPLFAAVRQAYPPILRLGHRR